MTTMKYAGAGLLGLFVSASVAAPAFAQEPSLTISPASAAPGQTVTVTADCVDPRQITDYDGTGPLADAIVPEGASSDEVDIDIPAGTAPGTYTATIECTLGGATETVEAAMTVTAPPGPSPMPTPTAMPSGAAMTGGGGSGNGTNLFMGLGAIAAAAGVSTILVLRRRGL